MSHYSHRYQSAPFQQEAVQTIPARVLNESRNTQHDRFTDKEGLDGFNVTTQNELLMLDDWAFDMNTLEAGQVYIDNNDLAFVVGQPDGTLQLHAEKKHIHVLMQDGQVIKNQSVSQAIELGGQALIGDGQGELYLVDMLQGRVDTLTPGEKEFLASNGLQGEVADNTITIQPAYNQVIEQQVYYNYESAPQSQFNMQDLLGMVMNFLTGQHDSQPVKQERFMPQYRQGGFNATQQYGRYY